MSKEQEQGKGLFGCSLWVSQETMRCSPLYIVLLGLWGILGGVTFPQTSFVPEGSKLISLKGKWYHPTSTLKVTKRADGATLYTPSPCCAAIPDSCSAVDQRSQRRQTKQHRSQS